MITLTRVTSICKICKYPYEEHRTELLFCPVESYDELNKKKKPMLNRHYTPMDNLDFIEWIARKRGL